MWRINASFCSFSCSVQAPEKINLEHFCLTITRHWTSNPIIIHLATLRCSPMSFGCSQRLTYNLLVSLYGSNKIIYSKPFYLQWIEKGATRYLSPCLDSYKVILQERKLLWQSFAYQDVLYVSAIARILILLRKPGGAGKSLLTKFVHFLFVIISLYFNWKTKRLYHWQLSWKWLKTEFEAKSKTKILAMSQKGAKF